MLYRTCNSILYVGNKILLLETGYLINLYYGTYGILFYFIFCFVFGISLVAIYEYSILYAYYMDTDNIILRVQCLYSYVRPPVCTFLPYALHLSGTTPRSIRFGDIIYSGKAL